MTDSESLGHEERNRMAMLEPEAYPHLAFEQALLQTHISWVFLAGEFAYKVKKPVRFDFLDYSTPELRRENCFRELQINRRFAPELYLDVVPVCCDSRGWNVRDLGPVVDWAVKMSRFSQQEMLLEVLKHQSLEPGQMIPLADYLARDHRGAEVVCRSDDERKARGFSESVPWMSADDRGVAVSLLPSLKNIAFIEQALQDSPLLARMREVAEWSRQQAAGKSEAFRQRIVRGCIRECHGDLHLGNLIFREGRFLAFDAIEFNESFRWIDVANELAFLLMDLDERGFPRHASVLLDRYLEVTGDYELLEVLRYYQTYRALVRFKVAWLRLTQLKAQETHDSADDAELDAALVGYLELAESYVQQRHPELLITMGVSGSGKSHAAHRWVEQRSMIRLRSDATRKRLLGLMPEESTRATDSSVSTERNAYDSAMTERTYAELLRLSEAAIRCGKSVIVDATFLRRAKRDSFRQLASRLSVPFGIVVCNAPQAELERRVAERTGDASEATVEVLRAQIASTEPLSDDEKGFVRELT